MFRMFKHFGRRILTPLASAALLMTGLSTPMSTTPASAAGSITQIASGLTFPNSGLILSGSAINPATGKPYRHIWYGDFSTGLCRLDPDLDTLNAQVAAGGPMGTYNPNTCIHFVANFAQFKPGQLAFDPSNNNVYAVDLQTKTQGIIRMHFLPDGDNGQGNLDGLHQEVLGGFNSGCGLPGNVPDSASLGPDGNLYVGFKQSGNIVKVVSPATEPLPCGNVQVMGTTADGRKDFGLAWNGHDLIGGDGQSAWIIPNADRCMTAANGLLPCGGVTTLGGIVVSPSATIADQVYPNTSGSRVFFANPSAITVLQTKPSLAVTQNFAVGFQFIAGMILDTSDPTNQVLYVGDDPANGLNPNQGRMWSVPLGAAPVLASAPATPTLTGGTAPAPSVGTTTTTTPPSTTTTPPPSTTTTTTTAAPPPTTTTTTAPAPSTTTSAPSTTTVAPAPSVGTTTTTAVTTAPATTTTTTVTAPATTTVTAPVTTTTTGGGGSGSGRGGSGGGTRGGGGTSGGGGGSGRGGPGPSGGGTSGR